MVMMMITLCMQENKNPAALKQRVVKTNKQLIRSQTMKSMNQQLKRENCLNVHAQPPGMDQEMLVIEQTRRSHWADAEHE